MLDICVVTNKFDFLGIYLNISIFENKNCRVTCYTFDRDSSTNIVASDFINPNSNGVKYSLIVLGGGNFTMSPY